MSEQVSDTSPSQDVSSNCTKSKTKVKPITIIEVVEDEVWRKFYLEDLD